MGRRCSNLTSVYEVMSRRTQHYEQEIQDFEVRRSSLLDFSGRLNIGCMQSRLAINLSNSRAITTLLHEAKSVLEVCALSLS